MKRRLMITACLLVAITAMDAIAQAGTGGRAGADSGQGGRGGRGRGGPPIPATGEALASTRHLVELEMMTWPEVKRAIHELGKTTALVFNGGTEHRGPQNVNGGHTLMVREMARAIAVKLGNAIVAPILAYSPNNANAELPGTIGLTPTTFALINEEIAEQLVRQGFKNVILMGDHGGGQAQLKEVAEKLNARHAPNGVHVYYGDDVYVKAGADFDKWLEENGYPRSSHAGIPDTSNMIYLGADKGWVRMELVPKALGNRVLRAGETADPSIPRVNNGINGDGRRSSAELGKRIFDLKVEYAVKQIQRLVAEGK